MDLPQITMALKGLEDMTNAVYDLKEALLNSENIDDCEFAYIAEMAKLKKSLAEPIKEKREHIMRARLDSMDELERLVSFCSDISVEELRSAHKSRDREYVTARQVHMAMLTSFYGKQPQFGASIYTKDRATSYHAIEVVHNLYHTDKIFRLRYEPVFKHCFEFNEEVMKDFLKPNQ